MKARSHKAFALLHMTPNVLINNVRILLIQVLVHRSYDSVGDVLNTHDRCWPTDCVLRV